MRSILLVALAGSLLFMVGASIYRLSHAGREPTNTQRLVVVLVGLLGLLSIGALILVTANS
jgi:hypothetical protein